MAKKALKPFSQDSLSTFAAWTPGFGLGCGKSWCGQILKCNIDPHQNYLIEAA